MQTVEQDKVRGKVRERYADIARSNGSCCCTSSCCSAKSTNNPDASRDIGYSKTDMAVVPEGANMGLGCGNPQAIAALKPGEIVLDLGCGGGFDCFLAARQVGNSGLVIGIDMTPDMLSKARENAVKNNYTNVEFRLGEIEHLPVADNFVDVIISNCVINLSPDKAQVFRDAFRVLRPGGRLAISDVVATASLPESIKSNLDAYCGCVSGAALVSEVEEMLRTAGFGEFSVTVKEATREFIKNWFPESGVENYVASANMEATKPDSDPARKEHGCAEAMPQMGEGCCSGGASGKKACC